MVQVIDNRHLMQPKEWVRATVKCPACKHEFCSAALIGTYHQCERCGNEVLVAAKKDLCDDETRGQ